MLEDAVLPIQLFLLIEQMAGEDPPELHVEPRPLRDHRVESHALAPLRRAHTWHLQVEPVLSQVVPQLTA